MLEVGAVTAGDALTLLDWPHPNVTVTLTMQTRTTSHPDRVILERLAALPALASDWRERMAQQLAED